MLRERPDSNTQQICPMGRWRPEEDATSAETVMKPHRGTVVAEKQVRT